jgi:endoglucanase
MVTFNRRTMVAWTMLAGLLAACGADERDNGTPSGVEDMALDLTQADMAPALDMPATGGDMLADAADEAPDTALDQDTSDMMLAQDMPMDMAPADMATASHPIPRWVGGVNIAGAEFGSSKLPGRHGTDYIYPPNAQVDHFLGLGMKVIRIPFLWQRIQPELNGELAAAELALLKAAVSRVTSGGAYALVDVHSYAKRGGAHVGDAELPEAALADMWRRLAAEFKDDELVLLGLMNEPNGLPAAQWLSAANASIAAIRAAGARNVILVPGVRWTGAHSWYSGDAGSNAAVMGGVVDPADNFIYELHQYLDSDSSGTSGTCVSASVGSERLVRATTWMREHNRRALLGEFAGGNNPTCEAAIKDMLDYMKANEDVWAGFTWWSAGPWWPGDYPFVLKAQSGADASPQTAWLLPYL